MVIPVVAVPDATEPFGQIPDILNVIIVALIWIRMKSVGVEDDMKKLTDMIMVTQTSKHYNGVIEELIPLQTLIATGHEDTILFTSIEGIDSFGNWCQFITFSDGTLELCYCQEVE